MPAPKVRANNKALQDAFDAFTDYLDFTEDFLRTGTLSAQIQGSRGIDVSEPVPGQILIEAVPEEFDTLKPFQLVRIADRLYIHPGHVHYKESAQATFTQVQPCIDGDSVYVDPRPFFDLPLDTEEDYVIWLVIDEDAASCEAEFVLLKASVDIVTNKPAGDHYFKVHEFTTHTDGLPIIDSAQTHVLAVEPVISGALGFTGIAYVSGRKFTGLNSDPTKDFVKLDAEKITAIQVNGPAPSQFPAGVEFYEKANTAGDLHLTRFG